MASKTDDLEAVRTITDTLEEFDHKDQERILRWAREKLGLIESSSSTGEAHRQSSPQGHIPDAHGARHAPPRDIRSFVEAKAPSSNNELVATIAYYYAFEAPESQRKESITKDDVQEACRLANRSRFTRPAQAMVHAKDAGLLDPGPDRGTYRVSTVGENLVAMTLPSGEGGAKTPRATKRSVKRKGKRAKKAKKAARKKR